MVRENAISKAKKGVLLVNLGSPEALTYFSVRRFLKEFLWDPRVVNLPRTLWWIILNFFVLPFRPQKSLKAYKKVWQDEGSPLIVLTRLLTDRLAKSLDGQPFIVKFAMRYGKPTIKAQLTSIQKAGIDEIIIVPLYPQYSSTTTASVYDAVIEEINQWRHIPSIKFISDYHQHDLYIQAIADSIEQSWAVNGRLDMLLMSFHGLPEQLTKWGDPYYYQCLRTAELIASKLSLDSTDWKLVFQSRFGKAKWLQPYCVEVLQQLPGDGIKQIDIVCPGFAVDCLETLEEIEMENKNLFFDAGGEKYHYIKALNNSQMHVDLMCHLIKGD